MLEMKVHVVGIDEASMLPVVILVDGEEKGYIPLVIGAAEASAISHYLEGGSFSRPLTHDLILQMLEALKATLQRVVITKLVEDTYYATISLLSDGKEILIDARPSDSIALAVRNDCPIFVAEQVVEQSLIVKGEQDQELEEFRRFLDNIRPEDFKKGSK